jgi:hypothetical protein
MESSATPSGEENKTPDTSKLQKGANLLFDALKKETIKQKNDEVKYCYGESFEFKPTGIPDRNLKFLKLKRKI